MILHNDSVVFNQKLPLDSFSSETKNFLSSINFNPEENDEFSMERIRELYVESKELFKKIVTELELFGCDFYPKFKSNRFPQNLGKNFKKLHFDEDACFTPFEINQLEIKKLVTELGFVNKKNFNNFSLERIFFVTGFKVNAEHFLDSGFEIIDNCKDDSIFNVFDLSIPKFILVFYAKLMTYPSEFIDFLLNSNIRYLNDLLSLDKEKFCNLIIDFKNKFSEHSLFGNFTYDFANFVEESIKNQCLVNDIRSGNTNFINSNLLTLDGLYFAGSETDKVANTNISVGEIPLYLKKYLEIFGIKSLCDLKQIIFSKEINYFSKTVLSSTNNCSFIAMFNPMIVFEFIDANNFEKTAILDSRIDDEILKLNFIETINTVSNDLKDRYSTRHGVGRNYKIAELRDSGLTLQQIGNLYSLSRERVRQILVKFDKIVFRYTFNLVKEIVNAYGFLPVNCLKSVLGFLGVADSFKKENGLIFIKELGVITDVFGVKLINNLVKKIDGEVIPYANTVIDIKNSNLCVINFLLSKKHYLNFSNFLEITTEPQKKTDLILEFLLSKGIDGIDFNKDLDDLALYVQSSSKNHTSSGKRALIGKILRNDVVLVGMSCYAHGSFVTEEMKNVCKNVLEKTIIDSQFGTVAIEIFNENKKYLCENGIGNAYMFYGICQKYKLLNYTYGGRSLRIFKNSYRDFNSIISKYMEENGPIVSASKITSDLGIREVAIQHNKIISKFGNSSYVLNSFIKCTENEFSILSRYINNELSKKPYITGKQLMDSTLFYDNDFNDFFKKNKIDNEKTLLYIIEIVYKKHSLYTLQFNHWLDLISTRQANIRTVFDLLNLNFKGKSFSKSDLENFCSDIGIGSNTMQREFLNKSVIRLGSNLFKIKDGFEVEEKTYETINKILNEKYLEEYSITASEAMLAVQMADSSIEIPDSEIEFVSTLSFYELTDWVRPINNINFDNKKLPFILMNKQLFDEHCTIKALIRKFIFSQDKAYMSYNEICKILMDYEIISSILPTDVFKQIFEDKIESGGVVKIK
ncbi:MAG: hypothetical protein MJ217_02970 [Bacilli bacterium]|nr:hypothetical protein [Bacilli bacterium]